MNHNLEKFPRLYPIARGWGVFKRSLDLLHGAKQLAPEVVTKTGMMLGLGEGRDEIKQVIKSNAGKVLSSVSRKLDYLVAGDNMGPAKLQKAEHLGISIISEGDLEEMINSQ